MLELVKHLNFAVVVLFTLLYLYQGFYVVVGLVRRRWQDRHQPSRLHRFAVIVSARNEEGVIGELLESLNRQNYPKELLDLYVVADNCTDDTAGAARRAGAFVYERFDQVHKGKGYAMDYLFRRLKEEGKDCYDGYFVFDADNLVDANFVAEMKRKMSLGIKQLKADPWETIEEKYPVGSKHTAKVRNFTNFGVFVEIEEGVDGLIHISDLSWTKKVKHPSEFTQIGADIEVQVLEIDKENRRLSLGHKQLEENPWDVFETVFTVGSVHEGTIIEMLDKGAVVALPYGVEGFATPKHLVKEDGSQAQLDEKLSFKVIEFNKDAKRIILSHSRIFEDAAKAEERAEKKAASNAKKTTKREEAPAIQNQAASTTLGDIDALAALKEQLENKKK